MNKAADYRTIEDKLFDIFTSDSTSEGEKFNAGALYFKRTGKLIQMHVRTPDPNVVAYEARAAAQAAYRSAAVDPYGDDFWTSVRRRRASTYRNAAGQWIDADGRAHDSYGRYTKRRD